PYFSLKAIVSSDPIWPTAPVTMIFFISFAISMPPRYEILDLYKGILYLALPGMSTLPSSSIKGQGKMISLLSDF
ncbi:MAG: hypothetical protein WBF32_09275, partial [Candidatus Aminicenantaceae bacterium]